MKNENSLIHKVKLGQLKSHEMTLDMDRNILCSKKKFYNSEKELKS